MKDLNKRKNFSLGEIYDITYKASLSIRPLMKNRKDNILSPKFIERIMLAVTEVNDCPLCSYGHTKMALEMGMSPSEIKNLLSGNQSDVPEDEIAGVMFAQHYAEYRGKPDPLSYNRIKDLYTPREAKLFSHPYE